MFRLHCQRSIKKRVFATLYDDRHHHHHHHYRRYFTSSSLSSSPSHITQHEQQPHSQPTHSPLLPEDRRDLESFRRSFDRIVIPDSLERVVNQHVTARMTGAEAIYRMLLLRGVEHVFGYSGGAVLPLIDTFHPIFSESDSSRAKIRFYNVANEQTAAHAAQAVGKLTGRPGVAIVTSGPGLTNCITAMQDAFLDGDPMVILSGQVPTSSMGTDAFQECPATALTKACTKWNYLAMDHESLAWAIDSAFRIATTGRKGPVHIDLPKNVLAGEFDIPVPLVYRSSDKSDLMEDHIRQAASRAANNFDEFVLKEVADRLTRCERPVLIVGHGAVDSADLVKTLAEQCDIPVTTTLHGMGVFDENHPLALCMLGMHGAAAANLAVQHADLVVSIGSRFDDRTTGILPAYAPGAEAAAARGTGGIVHFEIDRRQVGKTVKPHFYVLGDCQYTLRKLLPLLKPMKHNVWRQEVTEWKQKFKFHWEPDHPIGTIKTQQVIDALYRTSLREPIASRKITVTTGVGNHQMMATQFFRWTRPRQLVTSGGLGTMGTGLPFAIGSQVAEPDNLVLLIDGDGSFNMSSAELATVVGFNLPIKIAIMNDGVQQMVRAWQQMFFKERYVTTTNTNPDYVKLAQSYGMHAMRCDCTEQLESTCDQLLNSTGPMLVDFRVIPDLCLPMVQPGKPLDDMVLTKKQLQSTQKTNYTPGNAPA